MQGDLKWKHEPSWQDVIDFAVRVTKELEKLIEDDTEHHGIRLIAKMRMAIELRQHATLEQQKERAV